MSSGSNSGMFTYICFGTSDFARSMRFHDPVMAALGRRRWRMAAPRTAEP